MEFVNVKFMYFVVPLGITNGTSIPDVVLTDLSNFCHSDSPFNLGEIATDIADLEAQIHVAVVYVNASNVAGDTCYS